MFSCQGHDPGVYSEEDGEVVYIDGYSAYILFLCGDPMMLQCILDTICRCFGIKKLSSSTSKIRYDCNYYYGSVRHHLSFKSQEEVVQFATYLFQNNLVDQKTIDGYTYIAET
jgi:hypothetical protein